MTAADTVILYDPWWNPTVEDQAICRAHRIGQNKPVFVYRLIGQDTIEDKILELQQKKRALVQNLLTEGDGHMIELNQQVLDTLFAPLPEGES